MFIYWGTKRVDTTLGYTADFCYLCRGVQEFKIIRVGMVSHVYGLSVGSGKLVANNRECTNCGCLLKAETNNYASLEKRAGAYDIATLVQRTFPSVLSHYAARIQLEKQLHQSPDVLSPQLREQLLHEPFQLLAPVVERRMASRNLDWRALLTVIAGIGGAAVIAGPLAEAYPGADSQKAWALMGVVALTVAALVYLGRRSSQRYIRNEIYPALAFALRPLKPRLDELDPLLAKLARSGAKLGKKAKAAEIVACIALIERGNLTNTPAGLASVK